MKTGHFKTAVVATVETSDVQPNLYPIQCKDKGKFLPITVREGPEGE